MGLVTVGACRQRYKLCNKGRWYLNRTLAARRRWRLEHRILTACAYRPRFVMMRRRPSMRWLLLAHRMVLGRPVEFITACTCDVYVTIVVVLEPNLLGESYLHQTRDEVYIGQHWKICKKSGRIACKNASLAANSLSETCETTDDTS